MLKKRLIPKLQMKKSRFGNRMVLVTTVRFDEVMEIGDPVSQAKIYQAQAADELVFLDLDASVENREPVTDYIRRAAEELFMPLTAGGGVKTLDHFRMLLENGADKVSINTAAVENPELITRAYEAFGAQCVVVAIDYRQDADGREKVWIRGGRTGTGLDPAEWAEKAERLGAGEILLTSIDRDGTREGLDLETTRRVADAVTIPVITSGGCGLACHFSEGFLTGKADAVSAGTYFCFKDENPMQTRSQIRNAGIPIRIQT
ncbi:MAG: imidazole glycerol phosphate synthase cyclase subunit [Syntrophales bacterium]|nr:imidazole glycerol phosphate synthase cyclase subunit [Syntrophales bacterium]MDD5231866.1 imidazole glycerol phosphate synthase cyclase subunit [Syntrophales bacterium]MDD5531549.1 imidazole glycerol phosphate synthase cyclase subunit [Syntrophales bacterium]